MTQAPDIDAFTLDGLDPGDAATQLVPHADLDGLTRRADLTEAPRRSEHVVATLWTTWPPPVYERGSRGLLR